MEKATYIQEKIDQMVQFWLGWAVFFGGFYFLFLSLMDYIATPENFLLFAKYRFLGAILFTIIFLLNRRKINRAYQIVLMFTAVIISTCIIEYMILHFGGHASTYYAGIFILIMVGVGFIPIRLSHSISLTLIALVIYTIPIMIFDRSIKYNIFSMPLFFLVSTFTIANVWRYLSNQRLLNELSLQYDLEEKNKQLEVYSYQLKGMVEDRTRELRESEQWHRSIFENATDGILVLHKDGTILNASRRACEMHGFSREALTGTHIRILDAESNPELTAKRLRLILGGESLVFETEHNRKDGGRIRVEVSSKAITIGEETFIQSFYRDITEKKKIQEHLFQSQKLESIGVMAGGVAHDFNNILTAILGYTEIIRRNSEGNEKIVRSLNVIESAARKSGRMISQLLDFSRKKSRETAPFSMNDVVQDTLRLLERVIDKRIKFTELLESALPFIRGDVNQIEQVLMNLIVNARDAMPNGGKIIISTSVVDVRRGIPGIPPYIPAGQYVLLTVADTGMGIPSEVQSKIFEPFFTTKERGKGTGLGLSMAYGVIREHNGFITLQSSPATGTTFTIYLPAMDEAEPAEGKSLPQPAEGKETLLVVDDDEVVLNFVRESLEIYGYRVFTAVDPLRALEIFRHEYRRIDLVVTDVSMPVMNGRELIQAMRSISPAARILEISAYRSGPDPRDPRGPDGFMLKPFDAHALATTVRKILDGEPGTVMKN